MALGADSGRILRTVLKEGALLGAVGVVIGVSGGAGLTRLIKSILFGIEPLDMRTFATAVLLLFGLTLIASWIPARRATRIDPTVALRHD
jgi:ABC-type antimicrobial peptide transport system permease subunit